MMNDKHAVPPIYPPEVAAEAVYWAAHYDRREVFVGTSTDIAILGNKPFPQGRGLASGPNRLPVVAAPRPVERERCVKQSV